MVGDFLDVDFEDDVLGAGAINLYRSVLVVLGELLNYIGFVRDSLAFW